MGYASVITMVPVEGMNQRLMFPVSTDILLPFTTCTHTCGSMANMCLPSSSLLFEICHICVGHRLSKELQSSQGANVSAVVILDE
jgi:hypothetical protein